MVKDINKRISKLIEHYNYSNSEFADYIDVQRSSISHILSGRNKPSLDFLIKVKDQFPDLSWDWLINGEGEMMKQKPNEVIEKKPTSLPSLFEMVNDDNFGVTESEDIITSNTALESHISNEILNKNSISNSQSLDIKEIIDNNKDIDSQKPNNIKRIVLFYENGKFESFEP